ncbi:hypothetical protein HDU67_000067 [Dinochytrium kinnereticum]|nr:hypothetical protein HDU67_000067 [Dinochytrium kinnereticum]
MDPTATSTPTPSSPSPHPPLNPGLDAILRKGTVTHKRLTGKSRRNLLLVKPSSTEDVLAIRDELAALERGKSVRSLDEAWGEGGGPGGGAVGSKGVREKEVVAYGNLAFSAVTGNPLLILGTSKRTYIHFSKVAYIQDESDLGLPCQFTIVTSTKQEYKFICDTSPDYQQWITVLKDAYRETFGVDPNDSEDGDLDAGRRRSLSRGGRRNSSQGGRARSSSTVRGGGDGRRMSTASRGPPSRSVERDVGSRVRESRDRLYDDDEPRGPPKGRPASVRSTRSNTSTRTATPRAPGDQSSSSRSRPSRSNRGGPRAPGDGASQRRSSSAAGRYDDSGSRKSIGSRNGHVEGGPDAHRWEGGDAEDDDGRSVRSSRSVSLPRNVMGPNGQPLRSSLSRNKSSSTGALQNVPSASSVKPSRLIEGGSDEVYEIAKMAMETGLVDAPPPSPAVPSETLRSLDPPTPMGAGGEGSVESVRKGSTASSNPSYEAPAKRPPGHALKAGFATRSGSLVRFSGYDESIVISPDDAVHLRRPTLRANSVTDVTPIDSPRPFKQPQSSSSPSLPSSTSSTSSPAAASPRTSIALDRRRPPASPAPKQRTRTPSLADQRRVVNSLFDDSSASERGRSNPIAAGDGLVRATPAGRDRSGSRGPQMRASSSLGMVASTRGRDAEVSSIGSRASRSSSVGGRVPSSTRRRGSNASNASTIKAGAAAAATPSVGVEKEKSRFGFASLFGGGGRKGDGGEEGNSPTPGRRRSSSSSSVGTSGPGLMASLTLVPSVRVDRTASLASMFRKTAKDMTKPSASGLVGDGGRVVSPRGTASAAHELVMAANGVMEVSPVTPLTPLGGLPSPPVAALTQSPLNDSIPHDVVQDPISQDQSVVQDPVPNDHAVIQDPIPQPPTPAPTQNPILQSSTHQIVEEPTPMSAQSHPHEALPPPTSSPAPTFASLRPPVPPSSPVSVSTSSSGGTLMQESVRPATGGGVMRSPLVVRGDGASSVSGGSVCDRESMDSDSEDGEGGAGGSAEKSGAGMALMMTPPDSVPPSPEVTPKAEPRRVVVVEEEIEEVRGGGNGGSGKKVFGMLGGASTPVFSTSPPPPTPPSRTAVEPGQVPLTVTSSSTERPQGNPSAFRKAFETFNRKVREFGGGDAGKSLPASPAVGAKVATYGSSPAAVVKVGLNAPPNPAPSNPVMAGSELDVVLGGNVDGASPKALRRLGIVVKEEEEKGEEEEEEDEEVLRRRREAKGKARAE